MIDRDSIPGDELMNAFFRYENVLRRMIAISITSPSAPATF